MNYSVRTIRRASEILGYSFNNQSGVREYPVIDGTIYTDLFTGDVIIDGYSGTIKKSFNGKSNSTDYYNEITLDCSARHLKTVTLNLRWGSSCFCTEIKDLLDYLQSETFNTDDAGVSSKKIEDFSVSFKTADETTNDKTMIISENFSFYIRRPLIVGVSKESRHDERYF